MNDENYSLEQIENSELLSVEEDSTEEISEESSSVEDSTEEISEESSSVENSTEEILVEENYEIIYQSTYSSDDLIFIHEDLNAIHEDLQVIACLVVILIVFKVLALARTLIDAIF